MTRCAGQRSIEVRYAPNGVSEFGEPCLPSVVIMQMSKPESPTPSFQLTGLPASRFAHLATLDAEALARLGVSRVRATSSPGYPCRVSLVDAQIGEELFLLSYAHHDVESPYRSAGPVFVRVDAQERYLAPGEVPAYVRTRVISARAYDERHMMIAAEVCEGERVGELLERLFERPDVDYVQLHNAKPGCYSCEARRAAAAQ